MPDSNESKLRKVVQGDTLAALEETRKPYLILKYSHESAHSFLEAFELVRKERGAKRGALKDEEQDLLRMMVIIAAAGLDSLLKQLFRDCLPQLAKFDENVRQRLETFVIRQLRGEVDDIDTPASKKFLARILLADSHQAQVIEEYVQVLTGRSLQSAPEVIQAAEALGIEQKVLGINFQELREIFSTRNQIIHELDIDFDAARRNRRSRKMDDMVERTNVLLEVSEKILATVHSKLSNADGEE